MPRNPIPPNAGMGRPKGTKNKIPLLLKDMVLKALDQAGGKGGGVEHLRRCATDPDGKVRAAFLSLVSKCLPREIKADEETVASIRKIFAGEQQETPEIPVVDVKVIESQNESRELDG